MSRKRVWKIFQIGGRDEIGRLQSVAQSFPHPNHTLRIDRYVGGGFIESDLPVKHLRALFRSAGVAPFPDYSTQDTDPALDS